MDEAVEAQTLEGPVRSLYQMRVSPDADQSRPEDRLAVRSFHPGVDDAALLGLIAKTFPWHPDQQYDSERLAEEQQDPAYRAEDLLLYFESDMLVGFCWTQLHQVRGVQRGELKIGGVDPERAGRGTGRRLVSTGLHHLWQRGATEAYLYVDANNLRAVQLYISLAFVVYQTDRQFGQPQLVIP